MVSKESNRIYEELKEIFNTALFGLLLMYTNFCAHRCFSFFQALDKIPLIRAIINWVINFIVETVAPWIIERGGWVSTIKLYEPRCEKPVFGVSEQVQHKLGYTATEDG